SASRRCVNALDKCSGPCAGGTSGDARTPPSRGPQSPPVAGGASRECHRGKMGIGPSRKPTPIVQRMRTNSAPQIRSGRRRPPRRASRSRWLLVVGVAALGVAGGGAYLVVGGSDPVGRAVLPAARPRPAVRVRHWQRRPQRTILVRSGSGVLAAAVQDAAAAPEANGEMVLFGGLTASDLSTNAIRAVDGRQIENE